MYGLSTSGNEHHPLRSIPANQAESQSNRSTDGQIEGTLKEQWSNETRPESEDDHEEETLE